MSKYARKHMALRLGVFGTVTVGLSYTLLYNQKNTQMKVDLIHDFSKKNSKLPNLPTRTNLIEQFNKDKVFDVFIIGGGCTGCGVAIETARRGLSVALVDKDDFSNATSSRSTKLLHGGVRYLQNAVFNLDYGEYKLVKEALRERKTLIDSVPHLTNPIPIILPIYTYWEIPYFWFGLKLYDLVSGFNYFRGSYFLSADKTKDAFPLLKTENLKGSIVYYDGQQDDSRMNINLALTSLTLGSVTLNYMKVEDIKDDINKDTTTGIPIKIISLSDTLTGKKYTVKTKTIVNAAGPFTDSIRKMFDPNSKEICKVSSGTHLILPKYYCNDKMGVLDANTSDGRVLFLLPWQNRVLVGTTDKKCNITDEPIPSQEDIDFIIKETNKYMCPEVQIKKSDIKSVWTGIRPLVSEVTNDEKSSKISRNHVIEVKENMVTIAGGKWTTYRAMSEDTAKEVLKILHNKNNFKILVNYVGVENWLPSFHGYLIQSLGVDEDIAMHLSKSYGIEALKIVGEKPLQRLDAKFPYTEEEVIYTIKNEYAQRIVDVIARRMRLAFLDARVSEQVLEKVGEIMAKEMKWDKARLDLEIQIATNFINNQVGLDLIKKQVD